MCLKIFKPRLYVYQKVLLLFLLLLIPLFVIVRVTNVIGSRFIKDEISKSVMLNVDYYLKQLDKEMAQIKKQQLQLLNTSDLLKIRNYNELVGPFDLYLTVERIKERLSLITDSSNYVNHAGVYVKAINKTISTQSGFLAVPNNEYKLVEKCYAKSGNSYLNFSEDGIYLIETYPKKSEIAFSDKQVAIYTQLSEKRIAEGLSSLNKYKGSGGFLIDLKKKLSIKTVGSQSRFHEEIIKKYYETKDSRSNTIEVAFEGHKYWVVYKKSELLEMVVFSYFYSTSVTKVLDKFNLLFIVLFFITFIMIFVFSFLTNLMVHRPLHKLIYAFKELENGSLEVFIKSSRHDEFGYLFSAFNTMVIQLKTSISENYEQKLALRQSELKQLQSQINPHFLYNCFFNISRMCKSEDMESAMILAQKLGSYYRYITRSGEEEVRVGVEYQNAKDYVDIQSIRFANRILVHMQEIPEECQELMIPRIAIQPVLENAYEHAFEKSVDGGNIYISISCTASRFSMIIEDDGKFLEEKELDVIKEKLLNAENVKEKTGIVNVCRRLQIKYAAGSGLYASRSDYGGLKIEMVIIH